MYPLDSSLAERVDVSLRSSVTRGRDTFTYYPGTIRVPEGVLVTLGGRFGGWGSFIMVGKPEFAHSFSQQPRHKYRVASNEKLGPGKHAIRLDLQYDGPLYGKSGLSAHDEQELDELRRLVDTRA